MASVRRDKRGFYIARYRGITGKPVDKRVPAARLQRKGCEEQDAFCYAILCEQACASLIGDFPDRAVIHARDLGAIKPEQAAALLADMDADAVGDGGPATVAACYEAHAATRRERDGDATAYRRHTRELREFLRYARITYQAEVTYPLVLDYVKHMKAKGYRYKTRQHRLSSILRAAAMGAALHGLSNPLVGARLDRRGNEQPLRSIDCFTELELARALTPQTVLGRQPLTLETRHRVVLAMGALMGMRPSEIYRAKVSDWDGATIYTGQKTAGSRRRLPAARTVAAWLDALTEGRSAEDPLIGHKGAFFRADTFSQWCGTWLPAAAGRKLPVKCLRKTFATLCVRHQIHEYTLEAHMGHLPPRLAASTQQSYLIQARATELQPVADMMEQWLRDHGLALGPVAVVA